MYLPDPVCKILSVFKENNIEAYTVGGSVRDSLLLKKPEDFDITTAADPQQVKALFCSNKVIETGIKHGTVTVIMDSLPVEITTYRVEAAYSDRRHPDSVIFSKSLRDDLSRRDFTVNAICYHPEQGFYDPFDGRGDLDKKIIRTVGEAEKRFSEDALRILRALRFSSALGFDIEEKTKKAIFSTKELLKSVSKERVFVEFKKLLCGQSAGAVLKEFFSVLPFAVETLRPFADLDTDFTALDRMEKDEPLLLAAFFISLAKKSDALSLAKETLSLLKSDRKTRGITELIIEEYKNRPSSDLPGIKKFLGRVGEENIERVISLWSGFGVCQKETADRILFQAQGITQRGECYKISHLKIGGEELLSLGIPPKNIGKVLGALLEAVILDRCPNEKSALLDYVKEV